MKWSKKISYAKKLKKLKQRVRPWHACGAWDLSQERQFLETLVSNRFNYYMLLFGVILVYAFSTRNIDDRCVILGCGAAVAFLMAMSVHRVQVKLEYTLKLLNRTKRHPARRISRITYRFPFYSSCMTWMIGTIIPFLCSAILMVLFLATLYEKDGRLPFELVCLLPFLLIIFPIIGTMFSEFEERPD